MSRRTLAAGTAAVLAAALLSACSLTRTEDTTFSDPGLKSATPSAVPYAPMTVPFPTPQDNATVGHGVQGNEGG